MARNPRWNLEGSIYHCIARFVDRNWFFQHEDERAHYLFLLGRAMGRTDWRCLSYALMSNHIHLAMIAGKAPMASWTKPTHSPFARWMNKRHDRLGPLFAQRVKDYEVTPVGAGQLLAYIHNNPVRAGVVKQPRQSTWTSHGAYVGRESAPSWLGVDEGLRLAGFSTGPEFDRWVCRTPGESSGMGVELNRSEVRRRGALEIGTPTIVDGRSQFPLLVRPFCHVRPDPRRVVEVVSELTGVPIALICSRRRLAAACEARRIVAHCGLALGITPSDISVALGISPQAVGALHRRTLDKAHHDVHLVALERLSNELWGEGGMRKVG
ncbi:transposase [soil metagenome]